MSLDNQAILAQEAKTRLAQASTFIPHSEPWLALSEAAGSWVYDISGARYLDFGDGGRIALMGHGYMAPKMAIRDHLEHYLYAGSPMDCAAGYTVRLARELSERFPMVDDQPQQVLPCGSVAEARLVVSQLTAATSAVEIRVISADHSLDGGVVQDLVHQARSLGKLVVADETVTGYGRTGKFLGIDHYGFRPDIVILGPAAGAGVPFAAVVAPVRVFNLVEDVGPVFVSPVSCAAAYGILTSLTDEVLENVREMGNLLERSVTELVAQFPAHLRGLTGTGLLRQLTLVDPTRAEKLWEGCRDHGLIVGADLTLTPPLTVAEEEVLAAADVLADVLLEWNAQ